ncbi:MAG: hypothetical protein LAP21_18745, partial [Acidobacteriia bacterium]|nr:hypothetical protein [Terriglobia bacterium]
MPYINTVPKKQDRVKPIAAATQIELQKPIMLMLQSGHGFDSIMVHAIRTILECVPGTLPPAATPMAFNTLNFGMTRLDAALFGAGDFR